MAAGGRTSAAGMGPAEAPAAGGTASPRAPPHTELLDRAEAPLATLRAGGLASTTTADELAHEPSSNDIRVGVPVALKNTFHRLEPILARAASPTNVNPT